MDNATLNGRLDWVPVIFDRYQSDPALFLKLEQLCDATKNRNDFPFCRDVITAAAAAIAGIRLDRMYTDLVADPMSDHFSWIVDQLSSARPGAGDNAAWHKFVAELASFLIVYEPFLRNVATMISALDPAHLATISFTGGPARAVVRFIANDGRHMDVLLDRDQLESPINGLGRLLQNMPDAEKRDG